MEAIFSFLLYLFCADLDVHHSLWSAHVLLTRLLAEICPNQYYTYKDENSFESHVLVDDVFEKDVPLSSCKDSIQVEDVSCKEEVVQMSFCNESLQQEDHSQQEVEAKDVEKPKKSVFNQENKYVTMESNTREVSLVTTFHVISPLHVYEYFSKGREFHVMNSKFSCRTRYSSMYHSSYSQFLLHDGFLVRCITFVDKYTHVHIMFHQ